MAIDAEAKARSLGISLDDYHRGDEAVDEALIKYRGHETMEQYLDVYRALPKNQLIAQIRWKSLHKRFPHTFDWDGLKEADE